MTSKALSASAAQNIEIPESVYKALPPGVVLCQIDAHDTKEHNSAKTIGVVTNYSAEQVIDAILQTQFQHLIQNPATLQSFTQEVEISARMIENPRGFFESPVNCILGSSPKESYSVTFDSYAEKPSALDELANFLRLVPRTSTVSTAVLTIADELFTNAVLNAPGKRGTLNPAELKKVKASKSSDFFLGTDYFKLVIGCRDHYGTLDIQKVLLRLRETFRLGIGGAIRQNPATGAGIGLRVILDLCQSFYIAVDPGKESLVCCVLPLRQSMKETENASKNIHLMKL